MLSIVNITIYEIWSKNYKSNNPKILDTDLIIDDNKNKKDIFRYLMKDIIYEYYPGNAPSGFKMFITYIDKEYIRKPGNPVLGYYYPFERDLESENNINYDQKPFQWKPI